MDKFEPLKKGKDIFLYDIKRNRYYDFKKNSNIIGHSNKKLTNTVKNHISSSWDIYGDSIYHRRHKQFYKKNISSDHELYFSYSLHEFISRFLLFLSKYSYNIKVIGRRFTQWFDEYFNGCIKTYKNNTVYIYDMAEIFLKTKGNFNNLFDNIKQLDRGDITIFNYYWYPYTDIYTVDADIIIMPSLFSGNFEYINILIKPGGKNLTQIVNSIEYLPSLYITSSLKMYYIIENTLAGENIIDLEWKGFEQSGRLFSFENTQGIFENNIINKYAGEKILLNNKPPFYNYLPAQLEEYQVKYLRKVKIW